MSVENETAMNDMQTEARHCGTSAAVSPAKKATHHHIAREFAAGIFLSSRNGSRSVRMNVFTPPPRAEAVAGCCDMKSSGKIDASGHRSKTWK
jgi:hypothetical protein